MKTSLRRLFNYWLPPGHGSGNETPNPLVEAAIKINASSMAMLAGAEVDWGEIERENEKWWRLTERVIHREGMIELTRLSEEMGGYDAFDKQLRQCETTISRVLLAPAPEAGPKSTSPSTDQTQEPSAETKC
jgi:hypothetical protein